MGCERRWPHFGPRFRGNVLRLSSAFYQGPDDCAAVDPRITLNNVKFDIRGQGIPAEIHSRCLLDVSLPNVIAVDTILDRDAIGL